METRKIALACFIGGAVFSVVALLFTPQFWYLGLIAGFPAGYLSYEFREVRRALPVAYAEVREFWRAEWKLFKSSLRQPRPFRCIAVTLYVLLLLTTNLWQSMITDFTETVFQHATLTIDDQIFGSLYICMMVVSPIIGLTMVVGLLALMGTPDDYGDWLNNENVRKTLTYSKIISWILRGALGVVLFLVWGLWAEGCRRAWKLIVASYTGTKRLFILVHSNKRLLCGVDGVIGGTVAYLWLVGSATTLSSHIVLALFGGIFGAGLGILNWEVVSKRILHVGEQQV